jgi:hypothetical protein
VHCVLEGHGSVLRLAQKAAAEPNNQQYNWACGTTQQGDKRYKGKQHLWGGMSLTQVVVSSFRSCTTGSTYRRWRGGWLRSNLKIGICWRTTRTWRIDSRGRLISSSRLLILSLRLMIARSLLWLGSPVVVLMNHHLCPLKIYLLQLWMLVEIDREDLLHNNISL